MSRFCVAALAGFVFCWLAAAARSAEPSALKIDDKVRVAPGDWPWWRGPNRDGIAADGQKLPVTWSETENVAWKSPVPGRGHGSPTVVGDQVILATAEHDREVQSLLAYDRTTGKQLWQSEIHRGVAFEKKGNGKSSLASSTAACDGERVFINFLHDGAIYTTAVDRSGKKLWQVKVAEYLIHQGFASSPAIYGPLVIVSADSKGTGLIAALNRTTGELVWKQERPKVPNYTSPIIFKIGGRDQLLMTGCELVTSLDPLTGDKIWEIPGSTTECVTSTVTDGIHILTSGGYPKNHVSAIRADGSGKIAWENTSRVYVPSMLIRGGFIYGVLDAGVAICWKSDTGEELWKHRLGGTFSSSPVLAGENIYVTNEAGQTFVFKASPEKFEAVAENTLGTDVFATPTICGHRIYMRVAKQVDGRREETLYCVEEGK